MPLSRTTSRLVKLLSLTTLASFPWSNSELSAQEKDKPVAVRVAEKDALPIPDDKASDWIPLFNGKDLGNWKQRNGWAQYRIEGENIVGFTAVGSPNSFLCTQEDYSDFELRFEVKVDDGLNSGVQFRSKSLPEYDQGRVHGPQVEITSGPGPSGFIYGEATGRGWLSPTQTNHDIFKNREWNQYHIRAQGDRMTTWINGKLIEDIRDAESFRSGFIGLQVHGIGADQGPFQVRWRNIAIRKL